MLLVDVSRYANNNAMAVGDWLMPSPESIVVSEVKLVTVYPPPPHYIPWLETFFSKKLGRDMGCAIKNTKLENFKVKFYLCFITGPLQDGRYP